MVVGWAAHRGKEQPWGLGRADLRWIWTGATGGSAAVAQGRKGAGLADALVEVEVPQLLVDAQGAGEQAREEPWCCGLERGSAGVGECAQEGGDGCSCWD